MSHPKSEWGSGTNFWDKMFDPFTFRAVVPSVLPDFIDLIVKLLRQFFVGVDKVLRRAAWAPRGNIVVFSKEIV